MTSKHAWDEWVGFLTRRGIKIKQFGEVSVVGPKVVVTGWVGSSPGPESFEAYFSLLEKRYPEFKKVVDAAKRKK